MSGKCVIDTPQQFADQADKTVTGGIKSLYLPEEEVLVEPEDLEKTPRIKDTLQVHMVRRFLDIQKTPYLEFFNLATDKKPFLLNAMANMRPVDINATQSTIVSVIFVLPIINQLKNGFSAWLVWFGLLPYVITDQVISHFYFLFYIW